MTGNSPDDQPEILASRGFVAYAEYMLRGYGQWKDVVETVNWILEHDPDRLIAVDGGNLWRVPFSLVADDGSPSLWFVEFEMDDVRLGWLVPTRIVKR